MAVDGLWTGKRAKGLGGQGPGESTRYSMNGLFVAFNSSRQHGESHMGRDQRGKKHEGVMNVLEVQRILRRGTKFGRLSSVDVPAE